jgi:aminopeptidase
MKRPDLGRNMCFYTLAEIEFRIAMGKCTAFRRKLSLMMPLNCYCILYSRSCKLIRHYDYTYCLTQLEEIVPDSRIEKFAKVLVHYSLALKPHDKVVIVGNTDAAPLIQEVFREALRAGAYPTTRVAIDGLASIYYREASDEQLSYVPELSMYEINYWDAYIALQSPFNTKALSKVDPIRISKSQAASRDLTARLIERGQNGELRWCMTQFPNNAAAQDAGMSLADYEDFVYGAAGLNRDDPVAYWDNVRSEQKRYLEYLSKHNEIHIVAPGTDITYRVGGRTWINAAGENNMPDGEVFTGPIEDSANGYVSFTYPAVYSGNEVQNLRLTFENGLVVDESCSSGLEFLKATLNSDQGARRLGEVAFGLNYGIQQFSKNTLFDEKIGGTMHMALGMSYPETGGTNQSQVHWDIVSDLREGKVYADGELCYENGKFII